jgi:hypothetical protein
MAWTIRGSLGPESRPGYDSSGWLWENQDNGNARRALVEVTGSALAISERGGPLPEDTKDAIRMDGRSEVEKVLGLGDPPRVIQCGTIGCHPEQSA